MSDSLRILLADDDPVADTTCELFRQAGFSCERVSDVSTAVAHLRESPYDLLISDLCMPGDSGMSLIREVSALRKGLPVIIVTGCPSLETAIEAIHLPVAAYMVKPIDFPELLQRCIEAIEHSRLFRTMKDLAVQTTSVLRETAQDLVAMNSRRAGTEPDSIYAFLSLATHNAAHSLRDVARVLSRLHAVDPSSKDRVPCALFNCLRDEKYRSLLQRTVDVLEQTKGSFKSRALADLRKEIEQVMVSGAT